MGFKALPGVHVEAFGRPTVGSRLHMMLTLRDMTEESLADAIAMPVQNIWAIEAGKAKIGPETAGAIANALHLPAVLVRTVLVNTANVEEAA